MAHHKRGAAEGLPIGLPAAQASQDAGGLMPVETKPWDIQDYIRMPERQAGYLEACLEDGDPALIEAAYRDIAKAREASETAPKRRS